MVSFIGLAMIAGGPAIAQSTDDVLDDGDPVFEERAGECTGAQDCPTKVRQIGYLDSVITGEILGQIWSIPFSMQHDSPILLQGKTISKLRHRIRQELKATYQAGHTIVLLDASMDDIAALHAIIGEGVTYSTKNGEGMLAYALRREKGIPKATLLSNVTPSPLHPPSGDPDPTGFQDDELAFKRAADRVVSELTHPPSVGGPLPGDPNQPSIWQDNAIQTATLSQTSNGVYNTSINVFALHRCLDNSDHYVVTAEADWTATNAKFQSAATELGFTSMYYDEDSDTYVVAGWQDDPHLNYCSSPSSASSNADKCRYVNYPLEYDLQMVPPSTGTVIQNDATPPATQGQATSYQSGFSFSIGGTVNVSGKGPGAGISAGATWSNTSTTTVPPLLLEVGNTGNEGAFWKFRYCTNGEEPDGNSNCTSHVQMVSDVCRAQLGDFSGTNPQQGQTPDGKLSGSVQSIYWQQSSRVGSTFDIEVTFTPVIATTTANLWGATAMDQKNAGCNIFNCDCVSTTTIAPLARSITFNVPFPSTQCQ